MSGRVVGSVGSAADPVTWWDLPSTRTLGTHSGRVNVDRDP